MIMYPFVPYRTGAEGVVVDQNDAPIPNVELEAYGFPVSTCWSLGVGRFSYRFHADQAGKWRWYRCDAMDLRIRAYPPPGYGRYLGVSPDVTEGWMRYGEHRTNVVLRIRKLDPPATVGQKGEK